jgi:tetratricopeptide (TPR) repeat protein
VEPEDRNLFDDRLLYATVLAEIGELYDAELEVASVLEQRPEDLRALDLLAKIKHMRGELSAAIACWAQIHAKSPQLDSALMRLASMLQLARDTASGTGEFLVLGPYQLWRKPAAHLELEEVFRLFLGRNPDEAMERCDALSHKYRDKDPELFKLAVLAKAWIAELTGDPEHARSILEELGALRGFEADSDRIVALARIYERIGSPELLEKAVHIYQHFERRQPKVGVLGHLALLARRLGRTEDAERCEQRFTELFRRRMHRPSFEDAVLIASRRYVPLSKLARIRFWNENAPADETPRERAIDSALRGNRSTARELLEKSGEALDRKYLADLTALDGSLEKAVALYIECLETDSDDLRVVEWLLEHFAASGSTRVARYFRKPDAGEKALRLLESTLRSSPRRPSLWRELAALHRILGRREEAARCAQRASTLEDAALRDRHEVGRVLADAVYRFTGKAKGLIHEVWAARRPAPSGRGGFLEEILGNLAPEMTQTVRNTFLSVREYARAKWPHLTRDIFDYNYTYKVTKEDEPSGGQSVGLPSALAFLSVFLNRPVPQDIASSGVLVADSHDVEVVRPVGDPEYKVRGAYNRNLSIVILPEGSRPDLEWNPLVPRAVCDEIVRYAATLDDAVVLTFGEDVWIA